MHSGEIDVEELNRKYATGEDFWKHNKDWALQKLTAFKEELQWFLEIDALRQNGMYCDFKDSLKTPQDINREKYCEVYSKLKGVRKIGKGLIEILSYVFVADIEANSDKTSAIVMKSVNEMRDAFQQKDIYNEISKLIRAIGREKPLNILKEKFNLANIFQMLDTH